VLNIYLDDGTLQHPHPKDQYPFDVSSVQRSQIITHGHDWMYFGVFPNSETGLPAFKAQGKWFELDSDHVPEANTTLSVTGYGTTSRPLRAKNQVQQTHQGPMVENQYDRVENKWSLTYAVDTTGGNSGSAVVNEVTGKAVAIHAYAGCGIDSRGNIYGTNSGMFLGLPALQEALNKPRGVCLNGY
jgi:hypothetical protein